MVIIKPSIPSNLKWNSETSTLTWDSDAETLDVVYYKNIDFPSWLILTYTKEKSCIFKPQNSGEYLIRIKSGLDVNYSDNSEEIYIAID